MKIECEQDLIQKGCGQKRGAWPGYTIKVNNKVTMYIILYIQYKIIIIKL